MREKLVRNWLLGTPGSARWVIDHGYLATIERGYDRHYAVAGRVGSDWSRRKRGDSHLTED
jgi:hypothetical protein